MQYEPEPVTQTGPIYSGLSSGPDKQSKKMLEYAFALNFKTIIS